jgi:membrane protein DedA with SNARE-associated domain
MINYLISLISRYLYLLIFFSVFSQEVGIPFPPFPNEIILTFTGYQIIENKINFFLALLIVIIADILGASLFYFLALKLGRPIILKFGRYFLFSKDRLNKIEKKINSNFDIYLFRSLPLTRIYTSAIAGMLKIRYKNFIIFSSLGTLTWSFAFIFLGIILGENWQNFAISYYFIHNFLIVSFIILIVVIIFFILFKHKIKK